MENMQHSKPTETLSSGLSNLPTILTYPEILTFDEIPEIKGQFVYVIEDYPDEGLAIMIKREKDLVYLGLSDWEGKTIDFEKADHSLYPAAHHFTQEFAPKFIEMMKALRIDQLMVYIAVDKKDDDWKLVDLRSSLDKFYGPGMIRDLFGKIFPTQEVRKIVSLNEEVLNAIKDNKGSYEGNLILKCSKFKTITRDNRLLPLYARIIR